MGYEQGWKPEPYEQVGMQNREVLCVSFVYILPQVMLTHQPPNEL